MSLAVMLSLSKHHTMETPERAKRGGCWFASGDVQLHLGVEDDFRPARKAHPGLRCVSFDLLLQQLRDAGVLVTEDDDIGQRRAFVHDPFGNRIELIEEINPSETG